MNELRTEARNASLQDLAEILQAQHARKLDVVAPASTIRSEGGVLVIEGTEPEIGPEGVTSQDGRYRPTVIADEGIAAKLGVPVGYLKNLRRQRPDIYDANVNGWLHGQVSVAVPAGTELPNGETVAFPTRTRAVPVAEADARSFLVRCFRPDDDGGEGIARAFLSDSYKMIDNLDVLTAALEGVRASGMNVEVEACDLTSRRMYVRVLSREVRALAPTLLDGYRSPFTGAEGRDNPAVFAGFVIANSEVGDGAFTLTPRITIEVCSNGQTFSKDALRNIHLGSKLDDGVIRWSDDTREKNLELVSAQARDAVATFLDVEYVEAKIAELEEAAGVEVSRPQATVETVAKRLRFTQEQTEGILDHFIRGGQTTAGGVMQAVTSYAQTVDDADVAFELEDAATDALAVAAATA